jgi:hypothetical protein
MRVFYLLAILLAVLPIDAVLADKGSVTENSSHDPVAEISQGNMLLSKFVGQWNGRSSDGHFTEVTQYRWGPGNTHLLLDMSFFMDGTQTGSASGFFAWDEMASGLVFHMISSQGVVITQQQFHTEGNRLEMNARAINGASVGFPPEFRTAFIINDDGSYDSEVLMLSDNSEWQPVMSNHFIKVR